MTAHTTDRLIPRRVNGVDNRCPGGFVNLIAIPDHIAWSLIPRKGLGDLTRDPLRCRVGCHVDPDDISAIKPHDDHPIQQLEPEAGDHEEVHAGNVWRVVVQKSPTTLPRRPPTLAHVPSHP